MAILGITGPIYLVIALGYIATRQGLFAKADMQVFGKFTLKLALPALLFNALSQRSIGEILNGHYLMAYALGSMGVILGGLFWARKVKGHSLSYSSMMAMGMSCPNSGFVGYPIMLLTLGPVAGVALALNMVVENLLLIPFCWPWLIRRVGSPVNGGGRCGQRSRICSKTP
jgi:predicted permease